MKISVIIPVYNIADYIERCLISLFMQTYKEFEIILVDDCGQDNSMTVAKECIINARWNGIVRYVKHDANKGLSAARNSGIRAASGEYVYFLDGDDTIRPNCLELLVNHATQSGCDYVIAKYEIMFSTGKSIRQNVRFDSNFIVNQINIIELYRKKVLPWNAWNRLIRKTFILNNDLFFKEGINCEDLLWNFMSLMCVRKVSLLNEYTYQYWKRENSIMDMAKKENSAHAYDLLNVMEHCESLLKTASSFAQIIRYYLELRYDYVPYSILWHGYGKTPQDDILNSIFKGRLSRYYRYLPVRKKLLFLLPSFFIKKWSVVKFKLSEYKYIIKNKIFHKKFI